MAVRRLAAMTLLLAVAILVVGAGRTPVNDEPTGLQQSDCFECHEQGGGAFGPPLQQIYAILPPANITLEEGVGTDYSVQVVNTWTSLLFEIRAVLDLEEAPSIAFATDIEPIHDAIAGQLALSPALERADDHVIEVPSGATDFIVQVHPTTTTVGLGPDLELRAYPPGSDTAGAPPFSSDTAGAGETERLQIATREQLASAGYGDWTIQVAQDTILQGPAGLIPQSYTLVYDVFFNSTGERSQRLTTPAELDGQDPGAPRDVDMKWRLVPEADVAEDESLRITVDAIAYYDHSGQTSGGVDAWRYTDLIEVPIIGGFDGGPVQVVTVTPVLQPPVDDAIPWDRIGEITGYVSAFLLVFSLITGGVFGKASRRGLNKMFGNARRRIAFHNFVSYLLTFWAIVHTVLFIWEPGYPWTLGIIWGGGALLCMFLLGITGALQLPMVRRFGFGVWRWTHYWLGIGCLLLTVAHLLLDGANFTEVAEYVGWQDPF